jgi:hypothetical protein
MLLPSSCKCLRTISSMFIFGFKIKSGLLSACEVFDYHKTRNKPAFTASVLLIPVLCF